MLDRKELAAAFALEVERAESILIGTHLNPDGDALGSALAMMHHLQTLGVASEVVCHHAPPRNLRFLPGIERLKREPKLKRYDLAIMLDLESRERLGDVAPFFASAQRLVVIDHHVPHESPGDLRIVDTSAPATALILHRLFEDLGFRLTPQVATCLLTGIVTDTGSFRFRNTTPEALHVAANLLECGGDLSRVNEEIFQTKPLSSARLLGHLLETMRMDSDDRIAWGVLSCEDFRNTQARDEDTEGFVNELLFIETVQIAAVMREVNPGKLRCSLRSRGDLDVAAVARHFNGGGHRNAAGCTIELPIPQAEAALVERLRECLASS